MNPQPSFVPEIHFRNVSPSRDIIEEIHRQASKLQIPQQDVLRCRVRVDAPHRRHRSNTEYAARIELSVPDGKLVVDRKQGDNLLTAIQDAFSAAERQVQDYRRKRRGEVKSKTKMP